MTRFVQGLTGDTARALLAAAASVGERASSVKVGDGGFTVPEVVFTAYLAAVEVQAPGRKPGRRKSTGSAKQEVDDGGQE